MKTEKVSISTLQHPEKNVRVHTQTQLEELYRSFKMFGQIRPVVIDEKNIILAGNGLVQALRENGEKEIQVLRMKNLSEKDKKKLMIADNRIYSLGFDDNENILEILSELDGDFDVPGYEEDLLKDLLAQDEEVDEILEDYGKIEDDDKQHIADQSEKLKEKAENQPYIEEEEYEEELRKAETGEDEGPQTEVDEVEEQRRCPRCGGTGWL